MNSLIPTAGARPAALRLAGVSKRFGSLKANDAIDLEVLPGEVHAVVGENGAGKSTLMRIVFGMISPDAGTLEIDGAPRSFTSPADAIAAGIGMVHQHFTLVPSFTVAENVTLGHEPGPPGLYDRRMAEEITRDLAARIGAVLDPRARTGSLSVAMQQKVEIAKVLLRGARIVILDEPTAVLTPLETTELFALIRRLAAEGTSVIFISHKLREVLEVADRITVIRSGRNVLVTEPADTSGARLAAAMTGREGVDLGRTRRAAPAAAAPTVITLESLITRPRPDGSALDAASLTVRAGEIVGVAGVEGNGQVALVDAIVGRIRPLGGRVVLNGEDVTRLSVRERRGHGLAYVPEDRHRQGLSLRASVAETLVAGRRRATSALDVARPWSTARDRTWIAASIRDYAVASADPNALVGTLSGGNQQKLVLARELDAAPRCIVLAQPTRGVDLGAIETIYSAVAEQTARGAAVLLVSSDLDELFRLADRIVVIYRGRVTAELDPLTTTREIVGRHMMGLVA
jgi:ABC-type uncharacterized transport system ATPase subunit